MLSCTSPKLKVINNLCNHKKLSDKICVNMHNRRIHVITGVNYVPLQYLPDSRTSQILYRSFPVLYMTHQMIVYHTCVCFTLSRTYQIKYLCNDSFLQDQYRKNEIGKNLFLIVYWLTLGRIC